MRRIRSKYEEEKKRKRNLTIIGIVLIIVMFGSVFGVVVFSFGQNSDESKLEYNGYKFFNQNGLWYVSINNIDFVFSYHPNQTKDIESELNSINNYQNKPLYIYSEDYESEIEISRNLAQIVERMQPACLSEDKCEGDFPIKTCSDNFIIIEISEQSAEEINQVENCVYIKGKREDLLELTDEFLFNVIGIK